MAGFQVRARRQATLLNRILTADHGRRIAVVVNEFGEVGIDHDLLIASDQEVVQMNNGCICCTVRGDLVRSFFELSAHRTKFDTVVIETTGLAEPGPVAQTLYADERIRSEFALDGVVTVVQAGRVPEKDDDPRARHLTESLLALGQHGDRTGTVLALETGLESGQVLRTFLDRFDTGGLGANLDPANLLLGGFDPYESTRSLQGKAVHAHAQDARQAGPNRSGQLVPLGHGDIEWMRYLSVLEETRASKQLRVHSLQMIHYCV